MTELLRQVVAQVEQLPPAAQDAIGLVIQRELEVREWDALVGSPESQRFLQNLAAEARRQDAAGETEEACESW